MKPLYALVDCNNFYCSCERLFRPDLKGRPLVVLSNNDGCIIARSQEVKDLGIRMGTPLFKARSLIRWHNIQVFSSNYSLYDNISTRVMQTLDELAPAVEIYSIDEAFLNLSGITDPLAHALHIRRRVQQDVGVPVCVGAGPTKTLAKLANQAAKKENNGPGVLILDDLGRQRHLMRNTPVEDVWGVGHRLQKKLATCGIHTALDLADSRGPFIQQRFSITLERTRRELNGEPCIPLDEAPPAKQQTVCSRSFADKLSEKAQVRTAICEFAARAAEKLRREGQRATQVSVFLRTSPFAENQPGYSNNASGRLFQATCDSRRILALALHLFEQIWREGYCYAKAGVMLGEFLPQERLQFALFGGEEQEERKKVEQLMATIDQLNQARAGTVFFGGQQAERDSFMRQEHRSPPYTSRWEYLPTVR